MKVEAATPVTKREEAVRDILSYTNNWRSYKGDRKEKGKGWGCENDTA